MESEGLLEFATTVKRLKMSPYFDMASYVLMCMAVREDNFPPSATVTGTQVFSRLHPLSCWFGSMLLCFAGGILGNFVLGEPLLTPLTNEKEVITATVIWYLINYAPFDFVYKLCKFSPFHIIISLLKELHRANGVNHAILFGLKNFPKAYTVICLFGVLKGSASQHMRVFQRLMCGVWQPTNIEILKPSLVTKASFAACILLILGHEGIIDWPDAIVYFAVVSFFSFLRLFYLLFGIDPFQPFENLFCSLFLGGLMDALKKLFEKKEDPLAVPDPKKKNSPKDKSKEE